MQTAIHCAIQTLLDSNIHSLPLSALEIEKIIQRQGFEIVSYNVPLDTDDIDEFNTLGLLETAKTFKAFTYVDNDYKFVFYRATLSAQERMRLLAHELGHICLGHFVIPGVRCSSELKNKSPQEIEADDFAVELLAPTCILKKMRGLTPEKISHITSVSREDAEHIFFKVKSHTMNIDLECRLCDIFDLFNNGAIKYKNITSRHIFFAVLTSITAVSCTLILLSNPTRQNDVDTDVIPTTIPTIQAYQDLPGATNSTDVSNDIVVVTKSGEKYHRPNCRHVNGKNIFEITIVEAIKRGYEPCKDCF